MKIGIVSDIHTNIAGLRAAIDLMGSVDELICSGDAIFQYRFSNEVIALLRETGAHVILGNHEQTLLSRDGERARTAPHVNQDLVAWLAEQPATIRTHVNGHTLVVVHGSPWQPFSEYLYPTTPGMDRFDGFDADYVVLGHTHFQMVVPAGDTVLINSGSAGDARDPRNDWRLSFAVLDTAAAEVRFCNYSDPGRPALPGQIPHVAPDWTTVEL